MSRCRHSMRGPRLLQLAPTSPSSEAAKLSHCLAQVKCPRSCMRLQLQGDANAISPSMCAALCMR